MYSTYEEYLRLPEFRAVCSLVRQRSGGLCEQCKERTAVDPHHVRYCRWGEIDTPENLLDLCHRCHTLAHTCETCGDLAIFAKHIKRNTKVCDRCQILARKKGIK
jgi:hypothetical protein